jgi:hypothetical protein
MLWGDLGVVFTFKFLYSIKQLGSYKSGVQQVHAIVAIVGMQLECCIFSQPPVQSML